MLLIVNSKLKCIFSKILTLQSMLNFGDTLGIESLYRCIESIVSEHFTQGFCGLNYRFVSSTQTFSKSKDFRNKPRHLNIMIFHFFDELMTSSLPYAKSSRWWLFEEVAF